jgi:ABC-type phosphate transport system substrate-binding protein
MRKMLQRHRKGAFGLCTVVGAALITLVVAVPAGAIPPDPSAGNTPAGNLNLNGGGSNTTYVMMQQLSDLYNTAPGCNLITQSSSALQLNYQCPTAYGATGGAGDENGYALTYAPLNPYNDVVWQEPALGSSNGIKQLETEAGQEANSGTCSDSIGGSCVSPIYFARSSRAANNDLSPSSKNDYEGLNFVEYAADAVPWFHFTTIKGVTCPVLPTKGKAGGSISEDVSNIEMPTSTLTGIYDGSITDWSQVPGSKVKKDTAHPSESKIYVFMAQSGSGTESTWASDMNLTAGTYPYGGVDGASAGDNLIPKAAWKPGTNGYVNGSPAPFQIFENEVSDIYTANSEITSADAKLYPILCNSIFFFSYGKYSLLCPKNECAGTPSKNKGTLSALGEMEGDTAEECTILDTCNGKSGEPPAGTVYYTDRGLYNVYSDGSNANLPFATPTTGPDAGVPVLANQAVQNFVSTVGFLCNPLTHNDVDPLSPTNETYGTEIDNIIQANGFFQLPEGNQGDGAASIDTPPDPQNSGYDPGYAAAQDPNGTSGTNWPNAADEGYCRITTTDGDGNAG